MQQHIAEFSLYQGIKEAIDVLSQRHELYVVSGNVGLTVKKVVLHFQLVIPQDNIFGYRQGYPMENLARKKKVMQVAIDHILQSGDVSRSGIVYIGDETDDYLSCQAHGIRFIGCTWGNDELKQVPDVRLIDSPHLLPGIIESL